MHERERVRTHYCCEQEAAAHRDALLSRIMNTKKQKKTGNADLVASPVFATHTATMERLQTAWEASYEHGTSGAAGGAEASNSPYETTLREVVLVDTSNVVLALFKAIFCDHPDDPDPTHVKNMLLLLRLVDSVALKNGRRLRSAVTLEDAAS